MKVNKEEEDVPLLFPLDGGGSQRRLLGVDDLPPETGKSKFDGEAGNKASELRL